jgi:hypothetical protein
MSPPPPSAADIETDTIIIGTVVIPFQWERSLLRMS